MGIRRIVKYYAFMAVTTWRDYQDQVANLFRRQDCSVRVEAQIKGARAKHEIDVWVQSSTFGITQNWVIECKDWRRPVPKEKVMALRAIVEDVGADKGILVAESGYQEGAKAAAELTNIVLTTLEELRFRTTYDFEKFLLDDLERSAISYLFRMDEFWQEIEHPTEENILIPIPGIDSQEILSVE